MRSEERQEEFLLAGGDSALLALPDRDDPLMREIANVWGLPIGQRVRVMFKPSESRPFINGRLEVTAVPDLPFDRHQPLRLRVQRYEFLSTAITSWRSLSG